MRVNSLSYSRDPTSRQGSVLARLVSLRGKPKLTPAVGAVVRQRQSCDGPGKTPIELVTLQPMGARGCRPMRGAATDSRPPHACRHSIQHAAVLHLASSDYSHWLFDSPTPHKAPLDAALPATSPAPWTPARAAQRHGGCCRRACRPGFGSRLGAARRAVAGAAHTPGRRPHLLCRLPDGPGHPAAARCARAAGWAAVRSGPVGARSPPERPSAANTSRPSSKRCPPHPKQATTCTWWPRRQGRRPALAGWRACMRRRLATAALAGRSSLPACAASTGAAGVLHGWAAGLQAPEICLARCATNRWPQPATHSLLPSERPQA